MKRTALVLLATVTTVACERPTAPEVEAQVPLPSFSLVQDVSVTDLGVPGGGADSDARFVSSLGHVVVQSAIPPDAKTGEPAYRAFLWETGTITDLGTLGGASTLALGLNQLGQVVGWSANLDGLPQAFLSQVGEKVNIVALGVGGAAEQLPSSVATAINSLGQVVGAWATPRRGAAFLWEAGRETDLGGIQGGPTYPTAINDLGQIVGSSGPAGGDIHAFLWEAGSIRDLGTLGGTSSEAVAVNNLGQVVGTGTTAAGELHAFLWEANTMTDLGTLGGGFSQAVAVNHLGQVVGSSRTGGGQLHAFLWQAGTMMDLGTLGGGSSRALAVNDLGQVVGGSTTDRGDVHAYLWQTGSMTDLGTLGGPSSEALAVNDLGLVAGWATTAGGDAHAVLWTVTLRPATPEEEVTVLEDAVTNLVGDGSLSDAQSQPLLASLDVATRLLNAGNAAGAARLLEAFVRQVEALVRAGILPAEDGDRLIAAARNAIGQLGGTP